MIAYLGGAPFHGEFSSADASALSESNARVTLYGAGSATALTLNSNDHVCITFCKPIVGATGLTVQVFDGSDGTPDAGEIVCEGIYAANGGEVDGNLTPAFVCQKGTYPKIKTSASGAVRVQLRGYIARAGA